MKNVTIEFPNGYDEVLSMTAIGRIGSVINVATSAFDLSKGERIYCGEDGKWQIGKSTKEVCHNCGFFKDHCVCENPQTQADRIRSMSDNVMSKELIPLIMEICEDGVPCEEWFLKWLKSEVKE